MLATWITLVRFPLLIAAVLGLYAPAMQTRLVGTALLLTGLLLDTVDGIVARRRRETTLFGSVLDIAADRAYEIVLWFCLADLGLVPIVIPLVVVMRTVLTDGFRSLGTREGRAPFDQPTSRLAQLLVKSAWLRVSYGVSKVLAFGGLSLVHAVGRDDWATAKWLGQLAAWICVLLCLVRGIPVIVEGVRLQHREWRGRRTAAVR
jgi:phosphatidylglycerophosphate synthase